MANRIDKLRKQAVEHVEKRDLLSKQQSDNTLDKGIVQELLAGISDDDVFESIENHDVILDDDAKLIQEGTTKNTELKIETSTDTDGYLSALEDNLNKVEQMSQTSDLVKNTTAESSTNKRIADLQEIKKLLGEETHITTHESGVNSTPVERLHDVYEKKDDAKENFDNTKLWVANNNPTLSDVKKYASFKVAEKCHMNAEVIADGTMLQYYKAHDLEGHIAKVIERTAEAADVIEKIIETKLDRQDLLLASLFHDTGMDGGGIFTKDSDVRNNHSMTSALHILSNRDAIEADGGDADKIALLAYLHSKNKRASSVNNLNDNTQIESAAKSLSRKVNEFATDPDTYFDKKKFTPEIVEQVKNNAAALRLGDAFGHDSSSNKTQNGGNMEIPLNSTNLSATTLREEIDKAALVYHNVNGEKILITNKNDPDGYTRMYQLGEGNIGNMSSRVGNDGSFESVIEVNDGKYFPLSTQACITQRLEELQTVKQFDRVMTIVINGVCEDDTIKKRVRNTYNVFKDNANGVFDPININVIYSGGYRK